MPSPVSSNTTNSCLHSALQTSESWSSYLQQNEMNVLIHRQSYWRKEVLWSARVDIVFLGLNFYCTNGTTTVPIFELQLWIFFVKESWLFYGTSYNPNNDTTTLLIHFKEKFDNPPVVSWQQVLQFFQIPITRVNCMSLVLKRFT